MAVVPTREQQKEIRTLMARTYAKASHAMTDSVTAAELQVDAKHPSRYVALLTAAAKLVIPENYTWSIMLSPGGRAHLLIAPVDTLSGEKTEMPYEGQE
jgi:hypothetical protein